MNGEYLLVGARMYAAPKDNRSAKR